MFMSWSASLFCLNVKSQDYINALGVASDLSQGMTFKHFVTQPKLLKAS